MTAREEQFYCYVHIGAPKTGSTFLQRVFSENRGELLRHGLLYPDVSLRGFGHHDFAFLLSGGYPEWATGQDRPLDVLGADLAAAAAAHRGSVLLSSENFYLFPEPERLKRLLETTGVLLGRPPRIIVYLRRQDEAQESWYNQCVKAQGETGTIEQSLERFHELWDYEYQLGLWSAVFGDEALVVRRYLAPPSTSTAPSLIDDILDVLDIRDFVPHLARQHVNVRENRDVLSFQRQLNRLPLSPQEKRRFHRELMALSERAKGRGLFDERPLLDSRQRQAIMDRYAAGNEAVAKRYFGGAPLFPATPQLDQCAAEAPSVESGLTAEKMVYILGWLLAYKD